MHPVLYLGAAQLPVPHAQVPACRPQQGLVCVFQKGPANRDVGEPRYSLHAATCHMCVRLSWCRALSTHSNLKGFVSGRGATREVDY